MATAERLHHQFCFSHLQCALTAPPGVPPSPPDPPLYSLHTQCSLSPLHANTPITKSISHFRQGGLHSAHQLGTSTAKLLEKLFSAGILHTPVSRARLNTKYRGGGIIRSPRQVRHNQFWTRVTERPRLHRAAARQGECFTHSLLTH